jgi:hypothetical protein
MLILAKPEGANELLTFRQGINHKHGSTRRNGKIAFSHPGMMPNRRTGSEPVFEFHRI